MKVVLVYPPYRNEEFYGVFGEVAPTGTPNGIAYLASYLASRGHPTRIYDMAAGRMSLKDLRKVILREKPDLFGATANSVLYFRAKALCSFVKSIDPRIATVLGGRHPTAATEHVLRDSRDTDYLVLGEGEITAGELCDALDEGRDLREVRGLAFRRNGELVVTEPRPLIPDLDVLPFPAYEQLPVEEYHDAPGCGVRRTQLTLMLSRGCPHDCVFCTSPVFWRRRVRRHSAEYAVRLMNHVMDTIGLDDFWMRDDTFLTDRAWVHRLCDLMIEGGRTYHWHCETTVRSIEEEVCRKMRRAGCFQIGLGVETGSPRLIREIKGVTKREARKKIELLHRLGFNVRTMFLVTIPGVRHTDVEKTIQFAIALNARWLLYCLTVPYPDSMYWRQLAEEGEALPNFDRRLISRREVEFVPPGFSRAFLDRTIKTAYARFYFRPSYIWRTLRSLSGNGQKGLFWKYLKEGLTVAKYGLGLRRRSDPTSVDPFGG